jgi:hypothetical protein
VAAEVHASARNKHAKHSDSFPQSHISGTKKRYLTRKRPRKLALIDSMVTVDSFHVEKGPFTISSQGIEKPHM